MNTRQPADILLIPAKSVLPLIRTPIGYDIAFPLRIVVPLVVVSVVPILYWGFYMAETLKPVPDNVHHDWLVAFVLLCFFTQCCVFGKRAWDARHGVEIHSKEAGYSWLVYFTPLPVWLCEQVLVPGGFIAAGWHLRPYAVELGWWLIWCGLSLLILARWESRIRLAGTMGPIDGMIRAQTFEQRLDRHERQARSRPQPSNPQTASAGPWSDMPDVAELGSGTRAAPKKRRNPQPGFGPANPPDYATFGGAGDSSVPDFMGWLRSRRGR